MPPGFSYTATNDTTPYASAAQLVLDQATADGKLTYLRRGSWSTDTPPRVPDALMPLVAWRLQTDVHVTALLVKGESLAKLGIGKTTGASLEVGGSAEADVDALYELVEREIPEVQPEAEGPWVRVAFWSLSSNGPTQRTRRVRVPAWEDVDLNYPWPVRREVTRLADGDFEPGVGGQLLLWHGPAGTGKTWALRALLSEWRGWCDAHYITDPEAFFGQSAAYMLDVLLAGDDVVVDYEGDDADAEDVDPRATEGRWRLLILEDTGELMSADANTRSGQGLSRLLNTVDGLIGQGLRVLVLVTTNEELKALHPAVKRKGRCASLVQFKALGREDVGEWLDARGLERPAELPDAMTLADLFGLGGDEVESGDTPVGFAAAR